ncbi:MAG: hypothetical protein HYX40_08225 [Sphingobacteriales bacterium]|nr:hypothetical protein [Sphingobacteriales bacterium]
MIRIDYIRSAFFVGLLWLAFTGAAQNPFKKGYAYSRNFVPGRVKVKAQPGAIPSIKKLSEKTEYSIFIQGNFDTTVVKISAVWIKNKRYKILRKERINTPYTVFTDPVNKTARQLVPKVKEDVTLLWPSSTSEETGIIKKELISLLAKNNVVIEINRGNKVYYVPVKKITVLPSMEEV